ncbi:DUF2157 domain-containing protein [bacterium]|nr:DUF2157 domain-containing protein [bacterium]
MSSASIEEVANYADRENWPADTRVRAYALATRPVQLDEWRSFLDQNLLAGGSLAFLCGATLFVSAHWHLLGAYGKFILCDLLLLGLALSAWRAGLDRPQSRWALTVAGGLVGAILGLYSQTYPSDRPAYLFFLLWGGLILPWTLLTRFEPAWALWVIIGNGAMISAELDPNLVGMANLGWWLLAVRFRGRWGWPQLPMVFSWLWLTGVGLTSVFSKDDPVALGCWLLWLIVTTAYAYRTRMKGTLAALGFSLILMITAGLLRAMGRWNEMSWLLILGVAVTVQVALLIWALRRMPE